MGGCDHLQASSGKLGSPCKPERERTDAVAIMDGGCLGTALRPTGLPGVSRYADVGVAVLAELPWTGQRIFDIRCHAFALRVCSKRSQV